VRVIIYSRSRLSQFGTEAKLLRQSIESRGDTVVGVVGDDPAITGKGRYAGWRAALRELAQVDQIAVMSAGDLPGKSVADLLKILETVCDKGVSLVSSQDGIDTGSGSAAVIDLIAAYRKAKRSEAIRRGIEKARLTGKVIGRPGVPNLVRRQIQTALENGSGIRPTARRFNVSAGTVVGISKESMGRSKRQAA
jgi:DNA invertase Pin-like site-specific DNA recombinase